MSRLQKSLFLLATVLAASQLVHGLECTVERSTDDAVDDSQSILDAFTKCAEDSVITFSKANYSAYTPVTLSNLKNVTVHLNGNLLLPSNVSRVQEQINITLNQPSTYATPWFYIHGSDVSIIGSKDPEWGAFHGFGQQWWDVGNRILRPQLATFNVTNGLLRDLKVIKPVAWGWNLPGKNIRVENHFVDAAPNNSTRDSTVSFPFNTDGFNLSGQNITVDGYYGHNGDDCISVINGARDIVAKNGFCGFSSHGLSIGSLGRNGANHTVQNVLFKNWTMEGAVYGARFKSWTGGQGWADNVVWEDIKLVNVSTGIFITQNYYDQDKGPRPANNNNFSTAISNIVFKNFSGTLGLNWTDGTCISNPCWNYIDGISNTDGVVLDLFPGTAKNISIQEVSISPNGKTENDTTVICDPSTLTAGEQDVLGITCHDGPLVKTAIKAGSSTGSSGALSVGVSVLAGVVPVLLLAAMFS